MIAHFRIMQNQKFSVPKQGKLCYTTGIYPTGGICMKHWSNKKTLGIGLGIIAVCLAVCMVYMIANRSTKREPTQAETAAAAPYAVTWQGEGSEKEIILSMCTFLEEKTIGENLYRTYSSDSLGSKLYNFAEFMEIAESADVLYIQYTTPEGGMVTMGYNDEGLMELAIYDQACDTLYHQLDGTTEVWEKFRNGVQWGR